jgi:hypothetical protein
MSLQSHLLHLNYISPIPKSVYCQQNGSPFLPSPSST